MDARNLQATLNKRGINPPLVVDGIAGKRTRDAIDLLLTQAKVVFANWADARRTIAAEQVIYRDAGIEVGAIDGLVGEQTRYARTVWNARQSGDPTKVASVANWRDADANKPVTAPANAALKWPTQAGCAAFYGAVGTNQVMLELPFPQRIAWEPSQTISRVSCHIKCKDAFFRIWKNTLDHYGIDEIRRLRLDMFGGCLAVRKMRGGSAWSMHSWGIAWDVDPDRNQLKWTTKLATLDDPPYQKFWEFVEAEGGQSLGRLRDYDWMHFQFARL
jgi:hypothetical protein